MRKLVMKVELALETRGRQDVDKASGLEDTVVTELLQTMTTTAVYTVTLLFAEKPNTEATNGLRPHAAFALTVLSVSHVSSDDTNETNPIQYCKMNQHFHRPKYRTHSNSLLS